MCGQEIIPSLLKYQYITGNILVMIGWIVTFLYTIYQVKKGHNYNLQA